MTKKLGVVLASLVLLFCPLLTEAQPPAATATVALNLTIAESLTIAVSSSSLTLTSGVLSPAVTATISYSFAAPYFLDYVSSVSGPFPNANVSEVLNGSAPTPCTNTFTGVIATAGNGCHGFTASTTSSGVGTVPLTYQWSVTAPTNQTAGSYTENITIKAVAQ